MWLPLFCVLTNDLTVHEKTDECIPVTGRFGLQ